MFKRNIETQLHKWAESPYRKPLVLRGARQVGKTTVVNQFAENFENFISINLEKSATKNLMESTDEVKKLLPLLFLYANKKQNEGRTLLFIDEIQNSSHTISLLRYFYEETPEIYVIAAGSLLETMLDRHISLPVGRVEYMALHPCSFAEYLGAINENGLLQAINEKESVNLLHQPLIEHFERYALIGGMPEVVARLHEGP